MVIPQEEAYDNITKRLEEIKILLGEKINDPIVIICIHREKKLAHAKIQF